MRRIWIAAMAAALLFGAPPLQAQENTRPDHPADWDPDTREFIGLMPFKVKMAEKALLKQGRPGDARLYLTAFFVDATDRGEEKARAMGVQKGWDARMLGLYDTVRGEVRPLTDEPRRVYELAWTMAREAGAGEINPYSWRHSADLRAKMAWHLHIWSSMNGVKEAQFERAQGKFQTKDRRDDARFVLWRLAGEDFAPAIEQLASRYESGEGVPKNGQKALYWAMRGVAAGLPMTEQVSRLRALLRPSDVTEVDGWVTPPNY